ncbi:MAG: AAA family ATPase [Eubacteriales bacterium]|nr:AAA family ATPase [Eubacteriales bacterium]
MSNIFDRIDDLAKKRSPYSAEEIEKAAKKAKKTGKNFMDILQESSGKSTDRKPVPSMHASRENSIPSMHASSGGIDPMDYMKKNPDIRESTAYKEAEKFYGNGKKSSNTAEAQTAEEIYSSVSKDLEDLNKHLEADFGIESPAPVEAEIPVDLEAFVGLEDAVSEQVFGQTNFIKRLVIAFKRPFILPEKENHAKNCFYINGPEDTGKHYALTKLAVELKKRNILKSDQVYFMDLSRHNAAGKDNVFLQDLYAALQSEACIIVFENYEDCHISYLTYISDLVTKGECYLQDRYTLQKGQLINANNAFTKETVSTFTAKGKYLAFLGSKNVDSLANVFGAPLINALGDICTSEKLEEESYRKIAKVQWDALAEKSKKQFSFLLESDEESLFNVAVAATGKNAGTQGLISFFEKLLKSLATLKLEGSYAKDITVKLLLEDNRILAQIGEEKVDLMNHLPEAYTGDVAKVKEELDKIVGLSEIKKYILSLEEYYNTQKRRLEAGLKASDVSKHMIFTGNPGTGKTTIARIVSRYLKAIGVLTGGQLVEVSRADLVGRYVGHTAPLVNQVIKSALGGVLFIDEAYSLYRGKDDSFGMEAIDTLVKGIEDNRDNLIVILAGYSHEMEEFLEANSGLKSRFPNIIDFPDYTGEELVEITKITVKSKGYILDSEAESALLAYYTKVQATNPDTAGNGRLVRNKVEEAILNQSRRLVAEPEADLSLLILGDFVLE